MQLWMMYVIVFLHSNVPIEVVAEITRQLPMQQMKNKLDNSQFTATTDYP